MDQDFTCHYFSRCLSFLGSQVVGLTSPAAYSSPGVPSKPDLKSIAWEEVELLCLYALDFFSSVVPKVLEESLVLEVLGGVGAAFHVFLNGQSATA